MNFNKSFLLWPIVPFGAEDPIEGNEGSGTNQGNSGPQSNNPGGQANSGSGTTSSGKGAGSSVASADEDDDEYKDYSPKELRRILREISSRAKTAESERDSFKGKIDEAEREKLTKEQALEKDVQERDVTISTLRATNARLAIINAINADTRFEWHNAEVVAQQLDSKIVKVSDDGRVEGLAKELPRIAKDHDYLLKSRSAQKQPNNNGPAGSSSFSGSTGVQPGQGGAAQGGSTKATIQELAENYPALAARM